MELQEMLHNSFEKFRIDPAGFAAITLGVAAEWMAERADTSPDKSKLLSLTAAGLIVGGLVHVGNMFEYSRRIEATIAEQGFEHTQFRVRAYCLRQASRVVCQRAGTFDEYLEICKQNKDRLRFSFIPHI